MRGRIIGAMLAACVLTIGVAIAAEEPPAEKFALKDGSTLYMHPDGTLRMVDVHGKPMAMKDDVEMVLEDGRLIMMKNKYVWITIGPPGKAALVRKEQ